MNTREEKKGGGGKLSRSETVTVRLDPHLRYLAELAARKQRRTLSSYIEWVVEESLSKICLREGTNYNENTSLADEKVNLWDVDEADRFVILALTYPEMLNHHEQILWKLIRENEFLWKGKRDNITKRWTWKIQKETLILERLREHWTIFNKVAKGEANKTLLPKCQGTSDFIPDSYGDFDDDVPF